MDKTRLIISVEFSGTAGISECFRERFAKCVDAAVRLAISSAQGHAIDAGVNTTAALTSDRTVVLTNLE